MQIPHPAVTRPVRQAVESAGLYILLCSAYILVSGYLAVQSAATPHQVYVRETIKGIVFIVVTGVLFFVTSYLRWRRIRRQEETIIVQEKKLLHAERRLVAAMSAAKVAHDLNNLLMVLSGIVDGLKDRESDDPSLRRMREDLDVGIGSLSHLARRVASTVSRVVPDRDEEVDMRGVLQKLAAVVPKHPDIRSCRILSSDIAPLTLVLNRTLFEGAVLNLLINAAQAAGPTGQIEVRLATEQDAALLAIHDSGPGVPEELAKDIFEPCFTTKPDGTGIGLLAVTAFAASCGAGVSVGRSPLGGALFQLRIPIQSRPPDKTPESGK